MFVLNMYNKSGNHDIKGFLKNLFVLMWLVIAARSYADEMFIPSGEELFYEIPREWSEIKDPDQRKVPIQLMVTALKSNYQTITSFQGNFALASDFRYDKSLLNSDGSFNVIFENDPLWHCDFKAKVISDQNRRQTYRSVNVTESYFEYEGKRFDQKSETLAGTVSIDTPDEYVYLQNGDLYQGIDEELPGHPNIPIDNVAWIEQPEYNDNKSYDDNIDPYRYYDMKYWSSLDMILDALDGKYGEERQKIVSEAIRIFETTDGGGLKWFRYQQILEDHSEVNILWNESSSFLPIYSVLCSATLVPDTLIQIKWDKFDGIFFPVEILSSVHSSQGELKTRYRVSITDIHINEPLDQDQFTYGALGLQGESLIMNQIQKKVYRLKDGKLEFVANYNTKYEKSSEKLKFSRTRILFVVCGFVLVIAGGVLLRRQR